MEPRQRTEDAATERRKRPGKAPDAPREPRYHVYIRLPFNRGDFVDPGTVNWNEKKSEALWTILSDASLGNVNWTKLALDFDVSVDFLLQMANYLTERHTSQLRAHMLRAAAARGSNAPSPVPGAEPPGGYQFQQAAAAADPPRRTASGAGRPPSVISVRKDVGVPAPRYDDENNAVAPSPKTAFPVRPGSSRNSSANTAIPTLNQQQNHPGSRPGTAPRLGDPQRRRPYLPNLSAQQQQQQDEAATPIPPPSPAASTSSSSSSSSSSPVESRIIRRPPRFKSKDPRTGDDPFEDDDEDDDEPAFLPFNHHPGGAQGMESGNNSTGSRGGGGKDLGATLRGTINLRDLAAARRAGLTDASLSQTSDSSVGSAAVVSRRPGGDAAGGGGGERRGVASGDRSALSASRRLMAEAASGRGSGKRQGASREGSEGTPSMGSSFSDLDDASVTQSALEEALASRMQDGTIGSRMSVIGGTIGQAFKSRYLPKPNRQ
ncbi:hypothetical protein C8A05DRAFT_31176 [Staphylotrichum tortipilum]|uniref:Autophagy-related protein 29 n=1 Tax=Staphylotrichum tortipilum TaxID=2831512 RepID=A0AAN6MRC1_9PEZI|nr:hypothetical protein C8A05DRAFT_31176 [Staphylotrichum longicolle]